MQDSSSSPEFFAGRLPWELAQESIWPVIRFSIHRNLSGFPFPKKLPDSSASAILGNLKEALKQDLQNPSFYMEKDLQPIQKEFLHEHFLLKETKEKGSDSQASIIDETGQFFATINKDDHLIMHLLSPKENWENAWKRLLSIERRLDKELSFAFSSRFGYLTADPFLCGTGLIIEAPLHLPALVQSEKINEASSDLHSRLLISGLGKSGEFLADLVFLENKYKISAGEETLIDSVVQGATKLAEEEKKMREALKSNPPDAIKDRVSRAFGLLAHSFQLPTSEALSALSLIELGSSLGWIETSREFNFRDLFFRLRRAHITQSNPKTPSEEILKKRAEMLHTALQNTRLKI